MGLLNHVGIILRGDTTDYEALDKFLKSAKTGETMIVTADSMRLCGSCVGPDRNGNKYSTIFVITSPITAVTCDGEGAVNRSSILFSFNTKNSTYDIILNKGSGLEIITEEEFKRKNNLRPM